MAAGARVNGARQDTWAIRVFLNGEDMGIFDKKTGGELDSDVNLYYPGNMAPAIDLGGRGTTGNITLQREYDRDDDHIQINKWFNQVGKGEIKVNVVLKDLDGNAYPGAGGMITYVGRLKRVSLPDIDSESQSAAFLEIEVVVRGKPQQG